jgi:hypothetical protein
MTAVRQPSGLVWCQRQGSLLQDRSALR